MNQFNKSLNNSQEQNRISLVPSKNSSIFNIELHLPFKTVYPGKLDYSGEGYFKSKRKPQHIHQKLHAWGVNAEILERYQFKWIYIISNGMEYITSKEFLFRFGKRITYRNYETQYFLPLEMWGLDAVREYEKQEAKKPQQLSFFQSTQAA